MPPKAKKAAAAATKKETLEDPAQVKNGHADHYIGGWSYLQDPTDITAITRAVVQAATAPDRTVAPLPRTNVLILPTAREEAAMGSDADAVEPALIEVADKMQIAGITRRAVRMQSDNIKSWAQPPASAEPGVPPATTESPAPTEGEAAAEEQPAVVESAAVDPLEGVAVTLGADFAAADVELRGPVDIAGVVPQVVVQPELPEPPQSMTAAAAAAEAAAAAAAGKGGAPGKGGKRASSAAATRGKGGKVKLTPEQIAELEQRRAEEEEAYLRKTEEAVALAAAQETYMMTFAHPHRWATVTITNVTFAGPVRVYRAHVVFQNCRFAYTGAARPQLTVSQYCNVTCVRCTFDAPARCGAYVLPTGQFSAKRCLFTGVPHAELFALNAEDGPRMAAVASAVVAAADSGADGGDEEGAEAGGAGDPTPSSATGEVGVSAEVLAASAAVRALRPASVGVQVDSGKSTIDGCRFFFLGSGVVFHGRYAFGPAAASLSSAKGEGGPRAVSAAPMALVDSQLQHMYNTAIVLDAYGAYVHRNKVADCEYYGLDCRGPACHSASIQQNHFGVQAVVRIRERAHVQLLRNEFSCVPVDDNPCENPCMETAY